MKSPFRLLTLPVVISALTLQLSGCGESTNNLADPVTDESNTITTCDKKDICTSGQFVDEPVVGLNYECNKVKGITDKEGTFSCPNNSVATFYLQGEKGKFRIILGSYLVKATTAGRTVQITPRDLVKAVAEREEIGTDIDGTRVTNILRLLQALDNDGSFSQTLLNRIVITEAVKDEIDILNKDIGVTTFSTTEGFETLLQPFLSKVSKSLPTGQDAIARFKQSLPVLQSGVYEVSYFSSLETDPVFGDAYYTGMVGGHDGSNLHSIETMFFVIDRDGKSIGLGLEWQGQFSRAELENTLALQTLLVKKHPTQLDFNSEDIGFAVDGTVKPNFKLQTADGGTLAIHQGQMLKSSLLGNKYFYRVTYGLTDTEVNASKLGKWKRFNASGEEILSGDVNMSKTRSVSPFLDGSVWRTTDNVIKGGTPIFPLHLKLTLRDSDLKNSSCSPDGKGCPVGTTPMGITILENGNIITDRDNDCSPVDAMLNDKDTTDDGDANTPDTAVVQEHRLGMISAILADDTGTAIKSISPILMVGSWANKLPDNDPWKAFFGIYTGMLSAAGGPKVQINIANVLVDKTVTMLNQSSVPTGTGEALWTNYVRFLGSSSVTPEADRTKEQNQSQGTVSKIETQACYNPQPKAS